MEYDPLFLSRIQFAFIVSFHILFPAFTIGLAHWIVVLEGLYLATGREAYFNPDKGFSGSGFELIAGLKIELGLERVDLVGGDGRDDVNEGVDDGSMLGQIEGGELLDMADDGLGHVPGIEQGFIV